MFLSEVKSVGIKRPTLYGKKKFKIGLKTSLTKALKRSERNASECCWACKYNHVGARDIPCEYDKNRQQLSSIWDELKKMIGFNMPT